MSFDPHVTYCPRCRLVAIVVYLGGWIRVERCDACRWQRSDLAA